MEAWRRGGVEAERRGAEAAFSRRKGTNETRRKVDLFLFILLYSSYSFRTVLILSAFTPSKVSLILNPSPAPTAPSFSSCDVLCVHKQTSQNCLHFLLPSSLHLVSAIPPLSKSTDFPCVPKSNARCSSLCLNAQNHLLRATAFRSLAVLDSWPQ